MTSPNKVTLLNHTDLSTIKSVDKTICEAIERSAKTTENRVDALLDELGKILFSESKTVASEGVDKIIAVLKDNQDAIKNTETGKVFFEEVDEILEGLPEYITFLQDDERFRIQETDSFYVSLQKRYKTLFLKQRNLTQTAPVRVIFAYVLLEAAEELKNLKRKQLLYLTEKISELDGVISACFKNGRLESETAKEWLNEIKETSASRVNERDSTIKKINEEFSTDVWREIELAGTIESGVDSFQRKIETKKKKLFETEQSLRIRISDDARLFTGRFIIKRELLRLKALSDELSEKSLKELVVKPANQLISTIDNALSCIKLQEEEFDKTEGLNRSDKKLQSAILLAKEGSDVHLKQKFLVSIEKILDSISFNPLEIYAEKLLFAGGDVPNEINYHINREVNTLPEFDRKEIQLRDEMTAFLSGYIIHNLDALPDEYRNRFSQIRKQAIEISEMAKINLDSAAEVLEEKSEEGHRKKSIEYTREALERISEKLGQFKEIVNLIFEELKSDFIEKGPSALNEVCTAAANNEFNVIKWKSTHRKVQNTAINWTNKVQLVGYKLQDKSALLYRFIILKINEFIVSTDGFWGFYKNEDSDQLIKKDAAIFLRETDERISKLPLIYRKLFKLEPVENKRFLIGRASHVSIFMKSFEDWKKGNFSNFIVIGEKGSGKTSFLGFCEKDISGFPVKSGGIHVTTWSEKDMLAELCSMVDMNPVSDRNEFIMAIKKSDKKFVLFFEGLQNLLLRNMNGFEALEALLLIISQTGRHIFWCVSCSRYPWNYLTKAYLISEYFTHSCYSDKLSREEIRKVIESRHPVSGYELEFLPNKYLKQTRSYRKLMDKPEEQQGFLADEFFEELYELSEGNVSIAILYWLRSLEVRDEMTLKVNMLSADRVSIGDGISDDAVFGLAAVLMHDDLTVEHMAMVLNLSENESRLLLSRLASRNLLYVNDEGRYYLNYMLYRTITQSLKSRNILH